MLPHDGAGGCWPKPRNDRLASAMIAAATVMLDWTRSGGSMFGRMWQTAMRRREQPSARAASNEVLRLDDEHGARERRRKIGRAAIPIAINGVGEAGPEEGGERDGHDQERNRQHGIVDAHDDPVHHPPAYPDRSPSGC